MIWFCIVLVLLILFALIIFFCFKIAFLRDDRVQLTRLDVGPLAKYKGVFLESFEYIDSLPFERVYTESFDGLKLAGSYYNNNNSNTTILLFHGYRSEGRFDFSCAVRFYVELGLNVFIADQRAHGESEGKIISFGIKERKDVASWVDFLLNKYGQKSIFLSGVSMGATTVMMASNLDLPKNVKGIIADCGFTSAADIIKKVAKQSFKINATFIMPFLDIMCKIFGKFSIYEITTVKALSESDIPIFFIHGKADGFVPCEMTNLSYNAARAKKSICLVEGADHGLSFLVDQTNIQNQVADFIKTCS